MGVDWGPPHHYAHKAGEHDRQGLAEGFRFSRPFETSPVSLISSHGK